MKVIKLKASRCLSDEEADKYAYKFMTDDHWDVLATGEDTKILKPDGTPLLVLRSKVLPRKAVKEAFPALREAARPTDNRGYAAGGVPEEMSETFTGLVRSGKARVRRVKKDGTLSNTYETLSGKARYLLDQGINKVGKGKIIKDDGTLSIQDRTKTVHSGIIGYYNREARFPYCRLTAFNLDHPERFDAAMPLFKAINQVFQETLPERYAAQMAMVRKTSPDFVIHGTAFTTVTVNKNWQTAVHKDAGDLKEGFGVMTALRAGKDFEGCYLVFPKYRVAADMRNRDVLLADVHEWHGNTPLVGIEDTYERISLVLYYRERMIHCQTAEEERDRAQNRQRGTPLEE